MENTFKYRNDMYGGFYFLLHSNTKIRQGMNSIGTNAPTNTHFPDLQNLGDHLWERAC